jgi:hypothetical protein
MNNNNRNDLGPQTTPIEVDVYVAPKNGRAGREVVARYGDLEYTDVLDPFKAIARDRYVEHLATEWDIEDSDQLKHVKRLLVERAEEADALAERAAAAAAAVVDPSPAADVLVPYRLTPSGLIYLRRTSDGDRVIHLTNFEARIMTDVAEDDGVEICHTFEIEAKLGDRTRRFLVPASQFSAMNWAIENLGAEAVVYAGQGTKDHARAAVQLLSGTIPTLKVYKHLGWTEHNGQPVYLHAGGAIGKDGVVDGIRVKLGNTLDRFLLPVPGEGLPLCRAIRASLRMLDLAPPMITVPLFAAIWCAVVGAADFSIFITGPTGVGKSELVALPQQHWGAGLDARHLVANWASTANANEAIAFLAKDAILVIDDFAPTGGQFEVQKMHRDADRLLRGQGNNAGRFRMRADASLRPSKPPRGLAVATGEDIPRGQSLRARMLVLELSPGALDWQRLMACQRDAAEGMYATAMAGFVRWLAERRDVVLREKPAILAEYRAFASSSHSHKRTPTIVASLAHALRLFCAYAADARALLEEEANELWLWAWTSLGQAAAAQTAHQAQGEPVQRFIELLAAAIAGGTAHVAGPDGNYPGHPHGWGWRRRFEDWEARGDRVGWVDGPDLYLEPEVAYAAAQRLAAGDPLTVGSKTLHKRLDERGKLVSVDEARGRKVVRRNLEDKVRAVLHLRANVLGTIPVSAPHP